LVKQRYEVLAREYNDQNKQFDIRHTQITKEERDKRVTIQKGFDDHLSGIKTQLDEEEVKNKEAIDEIDRENADLAGKYEELKKEIDDKSGQMTAQLVERRRPLVRSRNRSPLRLTSRRLRSRSRERPTPPSIRSSLRRRRSSLRCSRSTEARARNLKKRPRSRVRATTNLTRTSRLSTRESLSLRPRRRRLRRSRPASSQPISPRSSKSSRKTGQPNARELS